jgi:hypothetical protein
MFISANRARPFLRRLVSYVRVSIVCVSGCVLTYANLRSFLRWFEVLNDNQPSPKRPRLDYGFPEGWLQLHDDDPWKIFGDYWRKKNDATMSDVLSITPANDEKGKEDPKYRLPFLVETNNKIIVRECYKPLYDYIRELRDRMKYRGIVVTGQPGTGASSS